MRAILIILATSLLFGCATPQTRIERNPEAFAKLTPDQQALVKAGQVAVGFDESAPRLAVGEPDRINERQTAEGRSITWVYYVPQSTVNPAFCSDAYFYYPYRGYRGYNGFGGGPYFAPPLTCFYNETVLEEFMRIAFKDGKVTSVERTIR